MDFVVEVLRRFFNMDSEKATDIMLTIHYKGKARCGTYSAEIAETKVDQVLITLQNISTLYSVRWKKR